MEPLNLDLSRLLPDEANKKDPDSISCLICPERFHLASPDDRDMFLTHMILQHKLVIGDVDQIRFLNRYLDFWRPLMAEKPLDSLCVKIKAMSKETGMEEEYFMLCQRLPADHVIRSALHRDELNQMLEIQEREREDDSMEQTCLFCSEVFIANRAVILNHMVEEHNFNIGHPDNLVCVKEFLTLLHNKLERLLCLYCEKTFKDRFTLKEHMRKKQHKRLNPKNTEYDRFYLVNYLEATPEVEQKRTTRVRGRPVTYIVSQADSGNEEEWEEGGEWAESQTRSVCLFCRYTVATPDKIFTHLATEHKFDLSELKETYELSFYHQVKIINYIRRQMHVRNCTAGSCEQNNYSSQKELLEHMQATGHHTQFLSDRSIWDQPEYYFPTYENDNLLSGLQCGEGQETDEWVIPEDTLTVDELVKTNPQLTPVIQVEIKKSLKGTGNSSLSHTIPSMTAQHHSPSMTGT